MGNFLAKGKNVESEAEDTLIISPRTLYNILSDLQSYSIIFDLRDSDEFKESHIDLAVNCVEIEEMVKLATQFSYTSVILYSSSSEETKTENDSLVKTFFAHMHRLDKNNPVPIRKIYMPHFETFRQTYPFMCTDSDDYEEGRLYPSQIADDVFLSNYGVASSKKVLQRLGITHCVNCTVDCPFAGEVNDIDSAAELKAAFYEEHENGYKTSSHIHHAEESGMPISRLRVPVVDESDQHISAHFERAIEFINAALSTNSSNSSTTTAGGVALADSTKEEDSTHEQPLRPHNRVIIHCKHGQSRSATVAAAWLIARNGTGRPAVEHAFTVDTALAHLKQARPKVCPNEGFIRQLHLFADADASKSVPSSSIQNDEI